MEKETKYDKNILSLRKEYYNLLSGKEQLLTLLLETEISEQVYNSNAIENSTLSLEETEKILLQIDLDRYITEREIFEAKNLARVIQYISKKAEEKSLDSEMVLFLHKMLISNIGDDIAGRFRKDNEWVKVGSHLGADPKQVEFLMINLFTKLNSEISKSIIKKIAQIHLDFESVHPFVDGNGRIGRVINNYLLIREGYVPINIKFIDRKEYYSAFKEYDEYKKTIIMERIVYNAIMQSYHKRLAYMKSLSIISLADYAKKRGLSHANLINKAKRQTIPAFLERGIWKIGMSD